MKFLNKSLTQPLANGRVWDKLIYFGLCLFIFLLPWQTRWIFKDAFINGEVWEYGRWSLYGTEIILIPVLMLGIIKWLLEYKKMDGRQRLAEIKNEFKGINLWLILLLIWSAVVMVWSSNQGLAWYGWLKLAEGVGLFWLITKYFSNKIFQGISHSLIAAGLIQAGFGISQFLNQLNVPANKWLGMARIDVTAAGTSVIEFLDMRWLRAYGGLPHPNILGGFLAICLLANIICLWQHQHSSAVDRKTSALNLFYGFSAIVLFLGLILSFSRGAWLAFSICFMSGSLYWYIKKSKDQFRISLVLTVLFCLVFGVVWYIFPNQLFITRFDMQTRLEKQSNDQRIFLYRQAQELFNERPVLGVGLSNYTFRQWQKDSTQPAWFYQPVHDAYFLTLVELGLPGFILLIMIVIHAFRYRSQYSLLLVALLILGLFDHYLRSLYFGTILWWLVIALNAAPKKIQ